MKSRILLIIMIGFAMIFLCSCNGRDEKNNENEEEVVNLVWYQIGEPQEDMNLVLEEVNEYIRSKIGATITIHQIGWESYTKTMQTIVSAGKDFDLAFTAFWANDFLTNAQRGYFLALDDLLTEYGSDMYQTIDTKFWEAVKVDGKIYGVPNEKELGSMPMWVFTKEYVDKYNIPYEEIHTLEDLEPWLKLIKENEPDVVPLYVVNDFSVPSYMDKIQDIVGVEYDDTTLTVKSIFETDKMMATLETMRKYYLAGYINEDAAVTSDHKEIKRFVTKGDGQLYADKIWSKDLGYEVVASMIMEPQITNSSARGAITAISASSKYPEKAMEFLNLLNTDEYLRNLLNYGIEGIHYEKVEINEEEGILVNPESHIYPFKIRLLTENQKNYSVPYWVQGGLFNTYVLETEPLDKWNQFQKFNQNMNTAPTFGFDFDSTLVIKEILGVKNVLEEYASLLYSGSIDPKVYVPELNLKLKQAGIQKIIDEMQKQIYQWKNMSSIETK
jgi:putative aldouronate transport system substrate-binding protein